MDVQEIKGLPPKAQIQKSQDGDDYVYFTLGYKKAPNSKDPSRRNTIKDYIGKIHNGTFVPNAKYLLRLRSKEDENAKAASDLTGLESKSAGVSLLLYLAAQKTGLIEDLKGLYSTEEINALLSLAFFELDWGSSLYRFPGSAELTAYPGGMCLSSSESTRLLNDIGGKEDARATFFKRRIARLNADEYLSYDSTKLETEAQNITDAFLGPTKEQGFAREITVSVLCGHKSRMPVMLKVSPGNLADVSTVSDLIHRWEVVGSHPITFVFDRGYESAYNLAELKKAGMRFLMGSSVSQLLVREKIRENLPEFWEVKNHVDEVGGYGLRMPVKWPSDLNDANSEKIDLFLYLYRPSVACAQSEENFYQELRAFEERLKKGKANLKSKLIKYFYNNGTKEEPDWQRNLQAISDYLETMGFFAFVSTEKLAPGLAVTLYRSRDWVEKSFSVLQSKCDMDSLRVHKDQTLEGKLLVGFIAMTLVSYFYTEMDKPSGTHKKRLREKFSFETLLDEFKPVRVFRTSKKDPWLENASKKLAQIANRLGLPGIFTQSLSFLYE